MQSIPKFSDQRSWHQKTTPIGHVDYGFSNQYFRDLFIHFVPFGCHDKECFRTTPCHGGCFAVNYDLSGDIRKPPEALCRYVDMQRRVSKYYAKKVLKHYPEGTSGSQKPCICYFEFYCGPVS